MESRAIHARNVAAQVSDVLADPDFKHFIEFPWVVYPAAQVPKFRPNGTLREELIELRKKADSLIYYVGQDESIRWRLYCLYVESTSVTQLDQQFREIVNQARSLMQKFPHIDLSTACLAHYKGRGHPETFLEFFDRQMQRMPSMPEFAQIKQYRWVFSKAIVTGYPESLEYLRNLIRRANEIFNDPQLSIRQGQEGAVYLAVINLEEKAKEYLLSQNLIRRKGAQQIRTVPKEPPKPVSREPEKPPEPIQKAPDSIPVGPSMKYCQCGIMYPGFLTECFYCKADLGASSMAQRYHDIRSEVDPDEVYVKLGLFVRTNMEEIMTVVYSLAQEHKLKEALVIDMQIRQMCDRIWLRYERVVGGREQLDRFAQFNTQESIRPGYQKLLDELKQYGKPLDILKAEIHTFTTIVRHSHSVIGIKPVISEKEKVPVIQLETILNSNVSDDLKLAAIRALAQKSSPPKPVVSFNASDT